MRAPTVNPSRVARVRDDDYFLLLRDATAEVADLHPERLQLRAENMQLSLLLEELEANQGKEAYAVAPTPPPKRAEETAARGGAAKSISIRPKCYLSQMKPQGEAEVQRLRVRPPPPIEAQRISKEIAVARRRSSSRGGNIKGKDSLDASRARGPRRHQGQRSKF